MHLFSLAWINNELYVDGVYHQGRQIYRVDMESGELHSIKNSFWDNRDQENMLDGMIYVKDQSGIMNLVFSKDGKEQYLTNVTGGAFMHRFQTLDKFYFVYLKMENIIFQF